MTIKIVVFQKVTLTWHLPADYKKNNYTRKQLEYNKKTKEILWFDF